jgi:hypothetical protein
VVEEVEECAMGGFEVTELDEVVDVAVWERPADCVYEIAAEYIGET